MNSDATPPLLNVRFRVEIEGLPSTGVVEVIFPEARILPGKGKTPVVQYSPLTLRRGMTASGDWYRWGDAARRSPAAASKRVSVVVVDSVRRDKNRWMFSAVVPAAYTVSHLNALQSELLMETLELSVGGFTIAFEDQPSAKTSRSR